MLSWQPFYYIYTTRSTMVKLCCTVAIINRWDYTNENFFCLFFAYSQLCRALKIFYMFNSGSSKSCMATHEQEIMKAANRAALRFYLIFVNRSKIQACLCDVRTNPILQGRVLSSCLSPYLKGSFMFHLSVKELKPLQPLLHRLFLQPECGTTCASCTIY